MDVQILRFHQFIVYSCAKFQGFYKNKSHLKDLRPQKKLAVWWLHTVTLKSVYIID